MRGQQHKHSLPTKGFVAAGRPCTPRTQSPRSRRCEESDEHGNASRKADASYLQHLRSRGFPGSHRTVGHQYAPSFNGLHAIVEAEFRRDIRAGDVFVFLNRRLDRIKLIHWDRDGLAIWAKRLERGTFQRPQVAPSGVQVEMDATDLTLLLSGIELTSVKRRPRYALDAPRRAASPRGCA